MASGVQKTAEAKQVKKAATAWPRVRPRRKVSERIAPARVCMKSLETKVRQGENSRGSGVYVL